MSLERKNSELFTELAARNEELGHVRGELASLSRGASGEVQAVRALESAALEGYPLNPLSYPSFMDYIYPKNAMLPLSAVVNTHPFTVLKKLCGKSIQDWTVSEFTASCMHSIRFGTAMCPPHSYAPLVWL